MSDELRDKIIRLAAQICWKYGGVVGNMICQDWDGDTSVLDSLTEEERDYMMREFEEDNSGGEDFIPGYFPYDGMVISFLAAYFLEKMVANAD